MTGGDLVDKQEQRRVFEAMLPELKSGAIGSVAQFVGVWVAAGGTVDELKEMIEGYAGLYPGSQVHGEGGKDLIRWFVSRHLPEDAGPGDWERRGWPAAFDDPVGAAKNFFTETLPNAHGGAFGAFGDMGLSFPPLGGAADDVRDLVNKAAPTGPRGKLPFFESPVNEPVADPDLSGLPEGPHHNYMDYMGPVAGRPTVPNPRFDPQGPPNDLAWTDDPVGPQGPPNDLAWGDGLTPSPGPDAAAGARDARHYDPDADMAIILQRVLERMGNIPREFNYTPDYGDITTSQDELLEFLQSTKGRLDDHAEHTQRTQETVTEAAQLMGSTVTDASALARYSAHLHSPYVQAKAQMMGITSEEYDAVRQTAVGRMHEIDAEAKRLADEFEKAGLDMLHQYETGAIQDEFEIRMTELDALALRDAFEADDAAYEAAKREMELRHTQASLALTAQMASFTDTLGG